MCRLQRSEHLDYCSRICCNQAVKNSLRFKETATLTRAWTFYTATCAVTASPSLIIAGPACRGSILSVSIPRTSAPDIRLTGKRSRSGLRSFHQHAGASQAGSAGAVNRHHTARQRRTCHHAAGAEKQHGFFIEAHAKLRPVDLASEGIFMAGTAHGPKNMTETIAQAHAAVARAATDPVQDKLEALGCFFHRSTRKIALSV